MKSADPATLTGPQSKALLVLAAGGLKKDAAQAADVHPQAVSEWMKLPYFRDSLNILRDELREHAAQELRQLTATSVQAIRDVLVTGPPALKLRAASFVLDRVLLMTRTLQASAADDSEQFELEGSALLTALGVLK